MREDEQIVFGPYPSTRPSLVQRAGDSNPEVANKAIGQLARDYSPPLRAYLAARWRRQREQWEDLLQGFLCDKVVAQNLIRKATRERGRFRNFLTAAFKNYILNELRRESAKERSPLLPLLPLDEHLDASPIDLRAGEDVDLSWARTVLGKALRAMKAECVAAGRTTEWELFRRRVLAPILEHEKPDPNEAPVAELKLASPAKAAGLVVTAKRRLVRHLRAVIADYAQDEREINEEIASLGAVFARGPRIAGDHPVYYQESLEPLESAMKKPDPRKSTPQLLAQLMDPSPGPERLWQPEELAQVLTHQLAVPIQFELGNLDRGTAAKLEVLSESEGLLLKSFADLLFHPQPPVELLRMVKDFAKATSIHPDSPLPREVAQVLYFASISTALVRCRARISELDDRSLRAGLESVLDQPWLDAKTRSLLQDGLSLVAQAEEEPP